MHLPHLPPIGAADPADLFGGRMPASRAAAVLWWPPVPQWPSRSGEWRVGALTQE
jgi:hypothetical protein